MFNCKNKVIIFVSAVSKINLILIVKRGGGMKKEP